MKWSGRNVIALLGFTLLGVIVLLGFTAGLFFAFPNLSIGGVTSVDERNSQTIYKGDEITEILTSRNFIVESETVRISFLMRKENQAGEGTIVVEENATGISFNSIKRTHIQWTMTSVDGEKYYKIKVLEPKGLVKRATPSIVYINLWRDSRVPDGTSTAPYNIILRTGKSIVTFGGDPVDAAAPEMMHINKLTVDSAASVSFPVPPSNPTNEFTVDISRIVVNGSGVQMDARCKINGTVDLNGGNGKFTFSSIGGTLGVSGSNNLVTALNTGNVGWGSTQSTVAEGSLQIRGSCGSLFVRTVNASIDINSVNGAGGADMRTVNGNLHINAITAGGLWFTASGSGGVSVGRVVGTVTIPGMGLGTINLSNVTGECMIVSNKTNAGRISVSFDPDITANPSVQIEGYDGNISVYNIRGDCTIAVRDAVAVGGRGAGTGRANIYAHFKRVSETVILTANTGYVAGHDNLANITVDLDAPIWGVLDIIGTSYAENQNAAQPYLRNSYSYGTGVTFWLQDYTIIDNTPTDEASFWAEIEEEVGHSVVHAHIRVQTATRFYLR
jgi:hypothetical protein